jgi:D-arabinose 1-dehydrogenase-like Zn-dependent alcohol dehydrogenase
VPGRVSTATTGIKWLILQSFYYRTDNTGLDSFYYRTDNTGLDIIFDTETNSHQYWHHMQLLTKGGTYVLLGLLARSLNDPWDKVSSAHSYYIS